MPGLLSTWVYFLGMSQLMEPDEAFNPVAIWPFGPKTVMFHTQHITRLIEEFFRLARADGDRYDCQRHGCPFKQFPRPSATKLYRFLGPNCR